MSNLVVIGLSITSSWGNGHATTYRALIKALAARGHSVTFLEQDRPWYADHRDLPRPSYCRTCLYKDPADLFARFSEAVREADAVIVGSYVADGIAVGSWARDTAHGPVAFYDIDTPVTLAALSEGRCDYLSADLIAAYDVYLSFTGGPALERLLRLGARRAAPLYCSVDPDVHRPVAAPRRWQLGYLGTYSPDRQPGLEALLLDVAKARPADRFAVAGAQYPHAIWPANVEHFAHLPPQDHARFYSSQALTLNLTRAEMRAIGWSPSVRLFEAAACAVPVVSDVWEGLEAFFAPGREIICARSREDVAAALDLAETERRRIGEAARAAVLARHSSHCRAAELETLLFDRSAVAPSHASSSSSSSSGTLGNHDSLVQRFG